MRDQPNETPTSGNLDNAGRSWRLDSDREIELDTADCYEVWLTEADLVAMLAAIRGATDAR